MLLLDGALMCDCLFDLNALLGGLRDDAMIDIWGCGGNGMLLYVIWIGKHELHDGVVIYDVSIMGTSDWLVKHVQCVSRA